MPTIRYPAELPVSERAPELVELIRQHQVLVVCGETGSGKSTQLPKICLEAGRGIDGMIAHTQPRRLAARSIAARLAEELGTSLGDLVGFTVRFTDQTRDETLVKVMTDGILLAEIGRDRDLSAYDTIIIDEAHERSLNIDFLLGYLRRLLPRRPDLRIIITSATIDPERFSRHFDDAPIVEVSGRTYPVEVRYRPPHGATGSAGEDDASSEDRGGGSGRGARGDGRAGGGGGGGGGRGGPSGGGRGGRGRSADQEPDVAELQPALVDAVRELLATPEAGDVLVFLPGEREIRDASRALSRAFGLTHHRTSGGGGAGGRGGRGGGGGAGGLEILPLYARLSMADQQRVFAQHHGRRVVLATNVAETSITVPGIRSVVDTGLARIARYGARTKVQRLPIEPISQASAAQRSGRCGRIAPGICIRLYSEQDFQLRDAFTAPEIQRTNLAGVILQMKSLRLGEPADFPFVEPPRRAAVRDGYDTLREIGALDAREDLTDIGRRLARLPIDPRLGRILLAGLDEDCFAEAVVLAAVLAIQDPRERPIERRDAADQAHAAFRDPEGTSDFIGLLILWRTYQEQRTALSSSAQRRWCQKHFLSWTRMREWQDLHRQLVEVVPGGRAALRAKPAPDDAVHRALLTGLLANVGVLDEATGVYRGVRGGEFRLHPGSILHKRTPPWVMAAEIVETTRMYARTVATVSPAWVEQAGRHLLKKSHGEPRWDRGQGRVLATERLSLFGHELGRGQTVDYGRVDPAKARELFIHHALVEREFDCSEAFFAHNGQLLEEIRELERRQRRHDVLVETGLQYAFYDQRLPASVFDAASLRAWLKTPAGRRREADRPGPLHMTVEDLVARTSDAAGASGASGATDTGRRADGRTAGPGRGGDGHGDGGRSLRQGAGQHPADDVPRSRRSRRGRPRAGEGLAEAATLLGLDPNDYPGTLVVGDASFPLTYRLEPGADDDGVTVTVPVSQIGHLDPARLGWLVPGLLEEKLGMLLRGLPKRIRRVCQPVDETVAAARRALRFGDGDLHTAFAAFLTERTGEGVAARDFADVTLPPHLHVRVRVVDADGRALGAGRDVAALVAEHVGSARAALTEAADAQWRRDGLTAFPDEPLPDRITITAGGLPVPAYPALVDKGATVSLRVLESADAAAAAHRRGMRRLFYLACRRELSAQLNFVTEIDRMRLQYHALASSSASAAPFDDAFMLLTCERCFLEGGAVPRDRKAFTNRLDARWSRLRETADEVGTVVHAILGWHAHLERVEREHDLPAFRTLNDDVARQVRGLLPPRALAETPWPRLVHLPRYLAAAAKRYERIRSIGPERDAARMVEVHRWERVCYARMAEDAKRGRVDPRVEAFRWLIEELRVSSFAQELGTAESVSPSRMEKAWRAIESG